MRLIIALLIGVLVYAGLSAGVLRKPLTIGYIRDAYDLKQAYADGIAGRKLVVVGGSSSLYGVRCQTIAADLGVPCVNMAVSAGIGIDLMLAKAEPAIRPGDVVLLPLEYDFYWHDADMMEGNSLANQYAVSYDRALLGQFGWRRRMAALFSLSLTDIYDSLVENALVAGGIQRRMKLSQLTPQGDMSGHTDGAEYAAYIAGLKGAVAVAPRPDRAGMRLLAEFIARQHARGVRVIGAFPTTIEDGPVPADDYDAIRQWWRGHGDGFADVPGDGRYPRKDFFDTQYHLLEPAQIAHSHRIATVIRPYFQ